MADNPTTAHGDAYPVCWPVFHGDYLVRLADGTELTLSRTYRDKLLDPLSQFL